jgi:hypothetical protein
VHLTIKYVFHTKQVYKVSNFSNVSQLLEELYPSYLFARHSDSAGNPLRDFDEKKGLKLIFIFDINYFRAFFNHPESTI